jgi:hypothetical protein
LLPEQLDDYEFEVYTLLRAWRLATCRPLDLEPYKVFQNRTLVEAVRRRRNDALWGGTQQQLLECWGIGPVKVRASARCPRPPASRVCRFKRAGMRGSLLSKCSCLLLPCYCKRPATKMRKKALRLC